MAFDVKKDRGAVIGIVIPDGGVDTQFDRMTVADLYLPGGSGGPPPPTVTVDVIWNFAGDAAFDATFSGDAAFEPRFSGDLIRDQ